jgi:hypothetical protein
MKKKEILELALELLEACENIAFNFTKQHIDSVCQDQTGTFLYNTIQHAKECRLKHQPTTEACN